MQIMEGDLARTIAANLDVIRHMQVADNPGRNEPGTGEINWPFLFDFIDGTDYEGWIGCEYRPAGDTNEGLVWIKPYLG
jgi:hydroxypyruvate isomerase